MLHQAAFLFISKLKIIIKILHMMLKNCLIHQIIVKMMKDDVQDV